MLLILAENNDFFEELKGKGFDFQTGDLKSRNNHTLSGCFKYCCISCSYKTSMFKDYQFHNKNVHIIKDCSSCDYSTTKIKYLSKHKSLGCYRHVCNLCEYKTSLHKNVMTHNKLYHAQEIRVQYTCWWSSLALQAHLF